MNRLIDLCGEATRNRRHAPLFRRAVQEWLEAQDLVKFEALNVARRASDLRMAQHELDAAPKRSRRRLELAALVAERAELLDIALRYYNKALEPLAAAQAMEDVAIFRELTHCRLSRGTPD